MTSFVKYHPHPGRHPLVLRYHGVINKLVLHTHQGLWLNLAYILEPPSHPSRRGQTFLHAT